MNPTCEVRERLKRFVIVKHLADDPSRLDAVAGILRPVTYQAGQEIIRKGEKGDEAFLLVTGTVEIVDFTIDQDPYIKAVLSGADDLVFGELGLVGSDVRTATVRARTSCDCWVVGRADFLRLGECDPRLGWLVLQQVAWLLAERLKRTNQDVLRLFEALVMEIEDGIES
jgi:CRP/FNR family transcriptional regulator, cyclic AMP receptor protein